MIDAHNVQPAPQALLAAHKLGEDNGMHTSVDDFGWIKAVHSPNWCELPEDQRMPPQQVPAGANEGSNSNVDEI